MKGFKPYTISLAMSVLLIGSGLLLICIDQVRSQTPPTQCQCKGG